MKNNRVFSTEVTRVCDIMVASGYGLEHSMAMRPLWWFNGMVT